MLHANSLCSECDEVRQRERKRQDLIAGTRKSVPERLAEVSFAGAKDPAAVARVRACDPAKIDRIVLMGPAGAGKTSLAICALLWVAEAIGAPGYFVTAFDLARARANHQLGSEAPMVDAAMKRRVVAIDELGREGSTALSAVEEVIHYRHAHKLPTIYTTGVTADALRARYDDGICRRIFEDALVIPMRAAVPARMAA
jgi:DNA replication protein DnaC